MRLLTVLLCSLALLGELGLAELLATRAISSVNPSGTTFKVHAKRVPADRYRTNPRNAPQAYKRSTPDKRETNNGNVTAWAPPMPAVADWEYSTPFTVGGQPFQLNLDTGSSDFWVFSESLPRNEFQTTVDGVIDTHGLYQTGKSTTEQPWPDHYFGLCYADGSCANGTVVNETIEFGGATVTGMPIGLATYVSDSLVADYNVDGIAGLAFKAQNSIYKSEYGYSQAVPQMTFLEAILPALLQPVFTAQLAWSADGAYEFGQINKLSYSGQIHYTEVVDICALWLINTPQFVYFGDAQYSMQTPAGQKLTQWAIIDTGATLLKSRADLVEAYYNTMPSRQFVTSSTCPDGCWIFSCWEKSPALHMPIGDGSQYNLTIPEGLMTYVPYDNTHGTCMGKLQPSSSQYPDWHIFGVALLKEHFVVFDHGNKQLGFANKTLAD